MTARNALSAVLTKSGSFRNNGRVKLARHLLNIVQLQKELNVYNYAGLTKAAAANQNKSERIKFAALLTQHAFEKKAFLGALLRGAGGLASRAIPKLGLNSIGKTFANAGNAIGRATLPMRARLQQGAAKALQLEHGLSPGETPSERIYNYAGYATAIPAGATALGSLANQYMPQAGANSSQGLSSTPQFTNNEGIDAIAQAGLAGQAMRNNFNMPQGFAVQ
jgi:hypothetical protein